MWEAFFRNKWALAIGAGIAVFLAFEEFCVVPAILFFPLLFNALSFRCQTFWSAFRWGFLTSLVIMLGGFYWVIYVIHEFGFFPWSVATLMYFGFCGFGALNFPLFLAIAAVLHRKIPWQVKPNYWVGAWFALGLPAFFTLTEFLIPKLFPWYLGHSLYRQLWLIQIAELTGATFLSFSLYSTGSILGLLVWQYRDVGKRPWAWAAVPALAWCLCVGFSLQRLGNPPAAGKTLSVALIQPNIGSLIKFEAKRGAGSRIKMVVDKYKEMTEEAMKHEPKPDLVLWPETAMPFHLEAVSSYPNEIRQAVIGWKTQLVTGGYAPGKKNPFADYNAAYLLDPLADNTLRVETYRKNILLAFGEYMPFGDWFPKLYRWFPEVSHFERGTEQNAFTLKDGTRLGVTICYEAIVPEFFRKVARNQVTGVINLTNDSWFGPTSEPYLHGSLTVFRSVETRLPMMRVTNTGTSFFVDRMGRMSEQTGVYAEGILHQNVELLAQPSDTFYLRFGDWFVLVCGLIVILLFIPLVRRTHVPVSI